MGGDAAEHRRRIRRRLSDASDGAPLLDGAVFATAEREAEDGVGRAVVDADFMRQDIEEALATLLPREAFVLRHRFGLASAAGKALGSGSYDDENDWLRATPEEAEEALRRAREAHRRGASEEGRLEKKKKKKNAPRGAGASFSKPGEHGGASRPLLGSLLGVSAETVRTIERRAVAKLKQPHRAGPRHALARPGDARGAGGERGRGVRGGARGVDREGGAQGEVRADARAERRRRGRRRKPNARSARRARAQSQHGRAAPGGEFSPGAEGEPARRRAAEGGRGDDRDERVSEREPSSRVGLCA